MNIKNLIKLILIPIMMTITSVKAYGDTLLSVDNEPPKVIAIETTDRMHYERDYQNLICSFLDGNTEVVNDDKTRIDCETDSYAIEFDFTTKFFECYGQALYYASKTDKLPACYLIIKDPSKLNEYVKKFDQRLFEMNNFINTHVHLVYVYHKVD